MISIRPKPLSVFLLLLTCLVLWGFRSSVQDVESEVSRIFQKSCAVAGCHGGSYPVMNLSLEETKFKAALVNVPSQERADLKLIDIENPDKSYLLMKVRGDVSIAGSRMPLNAPALSEESLAAIRGWITGLVEAAVAGEMTPVETTTKPGRPFSSPAFWGTRVINLPTPRSVGKNNVLFRISHRFLPSVSEGYDVFYGFNGPAFILLSLGYGITEDLSFTLGHSNRFHEWLAHLKWTFIRQRKNSGLPFSGAIQIGTNLVTEKRPGVDTFSSENFKFNLQLSLAHQLNDNLSLLVVPAYASNINHWQEDSQGTLALGLGGRLSFYKDFSVMLEIIPVLAGYNARASGYGLGLEKKIGGHVFQVFILNQAGPTTPQFLPGGEICLNDGDFRFGFNILRWF